MLQGEKTCDDDDERDRESSISSGDTYLVHPSVSEISRVPPVPVYIKVINPLANHQSLSQRLQAGTKVSSSPRPTTDYEFNVYPNELGLFFRGISNISNASSKSSSVSSVSAVGH